MRRPALAILLLLALSACSDSVITRQEAEDAIGIRLPPGAADVRMAWEGWQDSRPHVRFEAPAAELPAFLDSIACDERFESAAPVPPELRGRPQIGATWWAPGRVVPFTLCLMFERDMLTRTVLVERHGTGRVLVYVVAG
jgi:hypothetical protein